MTTDTYSIQVKVDSSDAIKAKDNLNNMEKATGGAEKALQGLARAAVGLVALDKLASLGKDFLDVNRSMEMLRAQLLSVTGSAVGAQKSFKFIQDFAKNTPFEIDGLTKSFLLLKNMGINPTSQVMSALTNQASKLGASQETLTSITMQLGQAYSKGKLQQEDMVILAERGVPIYKLLADVTGKNTSQLAEMSAKGTITRDVIDKLIIKMGEMSSGSNAVAMDTLNGKISSLSDAWHTFEDTLLNDKSEGFIKSIVSSITETLNILSRNMSSTLDDQISKAEARIKTFEGMGGVGKAIGDYTGYDINIEKNKLDALKRQKEKLEISQKEVPVAKESVDISKKQSEIDKEAAKAKKALSVAEANFRAEQQANIIMSEISGKSLESRSKTQLMILESERKAIEEKSKLSLSSATEQSTKDSISLQTQNALFASLDKTRAIEAAIINQRASTLDIKISTAQAELEAADKYNMTLVEQLRLKYEIAQLQAERELIPEELKQLDVRTNEEKQSVIDKAKLESIKAIEEAQTAANIKATAEMEILTAQLETAREMALGLADAFGSVGGAIGGIVEAFASYEIGQASINDGLEQQLFAIKKLNDGKGDQEKADKAISLAATKQASLQIKAYGDMTQSAQLFFKKGTAGYNAMGSATKVFRGVEMALSAISMAEQIGDITSTITAFVMGEATKTTAKVTGNTAQMASDQTAAGISAVKAVADASGGDPYTGLVRGALMLAFMVAIGAMAGGSSSGGTTMSAEDYRKKQEDAFDKSLGGTVLGSQEASKSIINSLEIISENSSADLDYTRGMANSLALLISSIDGISSEIAMKFNFGTQGLNLGSTSKSGDPMMGYILGGISGIFMEMFGTKTKITKEFAGTGIKFFSETLGTIVENGVVNAKQYIDILVTKTTSTFFGMSKKSEQWVETVYRALDKSITAAITISIIKTRDSIIGASKLLETGTGELEEKLKTFVVKLGRIPIGKDAAKNSERLMAAISKVADQMAMLNPMVVDFRRVGEGYYETLMRVSSAVAVAEGKLSMLGVTAISYMDVIEKTGDVEKQIIIQSLALATSYEDVNAIMKNIPGTADDAIEAYNNLIGVKEGLRNIGAESVTLNEGMIIAAGGIAKLKDSLQVFYDRYFTDQEKLTGSTQTLQDKFSALGLVMPSLSATVDLTTGVVTDAKAGYRSLLDVLKNDTTDRGKETYALVLGMAGDFADSAEMSAQIVSDKLAQINKEIEQAYGFQLSIYKDLAKFDPAAKEKALSHEREIAMQGMDDLTKSYANAAYTLSDVTSALAESEKELETAYKNLTSMRDKFVSLGKGLRTYLDELIGAKKPNATPGEIYLATKKSFEETSALAAGGDAGSLSSLPDVAKSFLDASLKYNSTGSAYQADYQSVLNSLNEGINATDKQIEIMNSQLDVARSSNSKLFDLDATTANVNSSITALNKAVSNYNSSLINYNSASSLAQEILVGLSALIAGKKIEAGNLNVPPPVTDPAKEAAEQARLENERLVAAAAEKRKTDDAWNASMNNQYNIYLAKLMDYKKKATAGNQAYYWSAAKTKALADEIRASEYGFTLAPNKDSTPQADKWIITKPALRAMGGMTQGMTIVGEQGPELINFNSPTRVTSNLQTNEYFASISESIKNSGDLQISLLKEQVVELQALINLQSSASVAMINELKEMKNEITELTRKAKLEASA